MERALQLAASAAAMDEVPVGALVADSYGNIIAEAHNLRESAHNPVAHAEVLAIEKASAKLRAWRLTGHHVIVTLEPCIMCSGAMILSRVDSCIFGAFDKKAGALSSLYELHRDPRLNHNFEAIGGVFEAKCRQLLVDFFKQKR